MAMYTVLLGVVRGQFHRSRNAHQKGVQQVVYSCEVS